MSGVMTAMFAVGVFNPVFASVCGGLWATGRIVYGLGYATNDSSDKEKVVKYGKNRIYGGLLGHLGDIPLFFGLVYYGYKLVSSK